MAGSRSFNVALALNKKENGYATQIADLDLIEKIKVTEIEWSDVETDFRTDEKENNGYDGPTEHEVESKKGGRSWKFNSSIEVFAAFLIWALGRVTSSGTNPNYTHTVKWKTVCTLNPLSFSHIEGLECADATGTIFLYKGEVVDSISLECDGQGPITCTIKTNHDGSETAKASFTFPASYSTVNRMLGSQAQVFFGPNATENISDIINGWKITINCGVKEKRRPSSGIFATEQQYGEGKPDLAIQVKIKGDKSHSLYAASQAVPPMNEKFKIVITKSATRLVQLLCSQGIVKAKQGRDGLETELTLDYMPEWNATDDGPGAWTIKNGTASYLNT